MVQLADRMREIRALSVEDRIELAEAIWESVEEDQDDFELTDAQKREIDRRLALYEANPDDVIPWETVRKRLQTKRDNPK